MKTETKHTPGPWTPDMAEELTALRSDKAELLEALLEVLNVATQDKDHPWIPGGLWPSVESKIRAAISKATTNQKKT